MAQYKLVDGKRELVRRTMPAQMAPSKPKSKPKPAKPIEPKSIDTNKEAS